MAEQNLDMTEYVAVLRRRKWHIVVPLLIILAVATFFAFALPPSYRSTATILVEQQEIPPDLVRSTVMGYAAERIEVITQRVMTRESLLNIAEKHDLFRAERDAGDVDNVVMGMRQAIGREIVSADVIDPRSGRQARATLAFSVSFDSRDPEDARKVTHELVQLYLEENARIRAQKAAETSAFLAEEARRLREHINELGNQLAQFKEQNVGQLPELMNMNLSLMERTERELEGIESQITQLEERKMFLETQLAQLQPHTGNSPQARLWALQNQYLSALALYSEDHPDMARMRREMDLLRAEVGEIDQGAALQHRLLQARSELTEARRRYSDEHPDVVRLQRMVESLEEAYGDGHTQRGSPLMPGPDNPAYINVRTQLEALEINLRASMERRERLHERLNLYERRMTDMPRVEQAALALNREYEYATRRYQEVRAKQLEAEVAEQLEKESKGERFSLIDPPSMPSSPISPNRLGILFLGTALSFAGGIGFGTLAEFMDRVVRGSRTIISVLGAPPLAVVPFIETPADMARRRRLRVQRVLLALATVVLVLLSVHLLWFPLDQLWATDIAEH